MKYFLFVLLFLPVLRGNACLNEVNSHLHKENIVALIGSQISFIEGNTNMSFSQTENEVTHENVAVNEEDATKQPKKVIKNIEYYLLAGFFLLLVVLYFFLRKKK